MTEPATTTTTPTEPAAPAAPAAPTSPLAPVAAPPAEPQPAPGWTEGMNDTDRAYVLNKAWADPSSMLASYRNMEHFRGIPEDRLVALPADPEDTDAWLTVAGKLGRPDSADGYDFGEYKTPEGAVDITPDFRQWAHAAGLNQRQVSSLFGAFGEKMDALRKDAENQRAIDNTTELNGLKQEWGAAYDQNLVIARGAMARFGINEETRAGLEDGLGEAGATKLLYQMGLAVGEHRGPDTAQPPPSFVLTPEAAKAKISELNVDPAFQKLYLGGNQDALKKMTALQKFAHPEQAGG